MAIGLPVTTAVCVMAGVHGIGIHDPGHGLLIGVHVGSGNVDLRSDEFEKLRGIAAGDALKLAGPKAMPGRR